LAAACEPSNGGSLFSASSIAGAVHRNAIRASRQRLPLQQTCRTTAIRLSIALVHPSERRSPSGRPRRITVSISSSSSRIEAETPAASWSSRVRLRRTRSACSAVGLSEGLTQHLLDAGVQRRVEPLDDVASLVHLADPSLEKRQAFALLALFDLKN
jgi:hypothetical protein